MQFTGQIGSVEWLNRVFGSPAARDVRGRSRPTQRFLANDLQQRPEVAEGGNTATARTFLTASINAGLVARLKLEPFALTEPEHGVDAVPDCIFQTPDSQAYVLETKSAKYLIREKLEKCRLVERTVTDAGLKYLLWTDAWPLTPAFTRNMRNIRRCGTSDIDPELISRISARLLDGPTTIGELRTQGLYVDCVRAAYWEGKVHFDASSELVDDSVVSADKTARGFVQLLSASVETHSWWGKLASTTD